MRCAHCPRLQCGIEMGYSAWKGGDIVRGLGEIVERAIDGVGVQRKLRGDKFMLKDELERCD